MAVFDLFSKRQKRIRGETPDVYVYDDIPPPLRVQLVQLISDGIGPEDGFYESSIFEEVNGILCREYGLFSLTDAKLSPWRSTATFILNTVNAEYVLDAVELFLRIIDTEVRDHLSGKYHKAKARPSSVISEINTRFKEHGVGFEFVSGELIRIDSQLLHGEVVKPALKLLAAREFEGANDEFLRAHEHYRHGLHKECIAECLKAFESTMKSICDLKGWPYGPSDTAKSLIEICIGQGLFPTFMQSHLGSLRSILESGVPTVRNKLGGHGQGAKEMPVSEATARYMLHLTASNILFFVESAQGLP